MRLAGAFALGALLMASGCGAGGDVADISGMHSCSELLLETGELQPDECRLEAGVQTMRVRFSDPIEGVGGNVSVDVLNDRGVVVQTLLEEHVSEYIAPTIQDIDGDGRADILIARESGNVNTAFGIWIYSGAHNGFRRVGEVSGYDIARTADGMIAVPARSGAASRNIAFYRLDETGLTPLATVQLDAHELASGEVRWSCHLSDAPGADALALSVAEAEQRFCAEPLAAGEAP
jgi:hypothetical protein